MSGGRRRDKEGRGHAEGSLTPEGLIYCVASTCEVMNAAGRTAGRACREEIQGGRPRTVDWAEPPILSSKSRVWVRGPPAALPRYARRGAQDCIFRSVRLPRPPYASLQSFPRRPCFRISSPSVVSLLGCIPADALARLMHDDLLRHDRGRLRRTDDVCMLAAAPVPQTRRATLLHPLSSGKHSHSRSSNPGTHLLSTEPTALIAAL